MCCSNSADTECGASVAGEDSSPVAALKKSSEEELEVRVVLSSPSQRSLDASMIAQGLRFT